MRIDLFVFIVLSGLFAVPVSAQQPIDTINLIPVEIEEISIQSAYSEMAGIETKDILILPVSDLSDILQNTTSLYIRSYGRGSSASIAYHGSGTNHLNLSWNGIILNSPMIGQGDLSLVPGFTVDGASLSSAYSENGQETPPIAGNLNVYTKTPEDGLNLSFLQHFGSFGSAGSIINISLGHPSYKSNTRAYYYSSKNDFNYLNDFKQPETIENRQNASFSYMGLTQDFQYYFNERHYLSLSFLGQMNNRDIPSSLSSGKSTQYTEYQNDKRIAGIIKYSYPFNKGLFNARATYHYQFMHYENEAASISSRHTSNEALMGLSCTYYISDKLILTPNLDANYNYINSENYNSLVHQSKYGISLEVEPFPDIITIKAIARQDMVDGEPMPFVFTLYVEKQLTRRSFLDAFLSAGRVYKYPSLNDLYWYPGGNPDLNPEQGLTAEGGIRMHFDAGKLILKEFSVKAWVKDINDWIVWQPSGSIWVPQNVKQVLSSGIDSRISAERGLGAVKISTGIDYTFTRSINRDTYNKWDMSLNKQLIYMPVHLIHAGITAGFKGFNMGINWHYSSLRYTLADNSSSIPAYHLADIFAGKEFDIKNKISLDISIRLRNIYNTDYQTIAWYPMPRSSIEFNLKASFKK